jgi:hypothetical protein
MGRFGPMNDAMQRDTELNAKIENADGPFIAWSDLNLDGAVQNDEVQVGHFYGGLMFDRDLSVCTEAGWALPAPRITERGVPVWDLEAATKFNEHPPHWLGNALEADEDTYVMSPGWGGWGGGPMTAWRDGRRQWLYHAQLGNIAMGPQFPGQLLKPNRYIGFRFQPAGSEVGPMFALNGYRGSIFVFTADGLFVTDLGGNVRSKPLLRLPDARPGMLIDDVSFNDEHFWPAVTEMSDGSIYLAAGKEFTAIFEIEHLDTIRPLPAQPLTVTPDMLEGRPEVRIDQPKPEEGEQTLTIRQPDAAPEVDGRLDEWDDADWVEIGAARDLHGTVMVHGEMLYAAWRIGDPKLLNNNTPEGWRQAFATGGGLDLMIRTRPDAETARLGKRTGSRYDLASEGDIRLLVTRQGDPVDGSVLAIRFQQVGDGPGEPVEYVSPVGQVRFDAVADVSRRVKLAQSDGNYELAVPLSVIGLDVKAGLETSGDIGVLIGNGMETRVRLYWANDGAAIVSDIPNEAKLMPANWGTWRFE